MIELKNDKLRFSFPDLHPDARCTVFFPMDPPDSRSRQNLAVASGTGPFSRVMLFQFKGWMCRAAFLPAKHDMLAEFTCRVAAGSNDWFASKSLLVVWRAGNLL
jgi:hypothetical protein